MILDLLTLALVTLTFGLLNLDLLNFGPYVIDPFIHGEKVRIEPALQVEDLAGYIIMQPMSVNYVPTEPQQVDICGV